MRIHFLVFLLEIIILAGAIPVSSFEQFEPAIPSKTTEISTPYSIADANPEDEEKVNIPELANGAAKIAHLASKMNPSAQKLALRLWLEAGTSPKDVFKLLNLKQLITSGVKLDDNPTLLEWLRYTAAYKARRPSDHLFQDGEIYLMLAKRVPEADVATFIQSLKGVSDLKTLGETLQKTQYYAWWRTGLEPKNVEKLLGITDSMKTFDPKYSVYLGYVQVWLGNTRIVL
ncbi:hypothetical protein PR003_g31697 [Phytophthora rubi]|uniref:Uncharacterized protein n=1 Tax=Phytophthora rubi TaxID=129364 RepID=A0A6A3GS91_9STRA|nr:hypothetical protein PR001_g30982 [Phytophthora rubi]KAE8959588.1 hypothetical protein PR002_g30493 [Phytophthora rubi]KAE9267681.1 hypothetical protein PR003_g31697 [Phytophthora rubi]